MELEDFGFFKSDHGGLGSGSGEGFGCNQGGNGGFQPGVGVGGEKKILNGECWVLNCKFVLHLCPYYERGVAGTATGGMEGKKILNGGF
jgi:hypothetical protein